MNVDNETIEAGLWILRNREDGALRIVDVDRYQGDVPHVYFMGCGEFERGIDGLLKREEFVRRLDLAALAQGAP